jgi:hypothetical protein
MLGKLMLATAVSATALLALAPAATAGPPTAQKPTIVVEPIDSHDVHEEIDGTIIETRVLGIRRIVTYPNGRMHMSETYTMDQTATKAGDLVYDSSASTRSRVIAAGEVTVLFSLASHIDMLWGDGRDCDIDTRYVVARDKVVVNEQVGPVCTMP